MHKNNLRIENHPVLGEYIKGKEVKITFDGKVITGEIIFYLKKGDNYGIQR